MKTFFLLFVNTLVFMTFTFPCFILSQSQTELTFQNYGDIQRLHCFKVQCLPVSAIYNGEGQLNLISTTRTEDNNLNDYSKYFNVGTFSYSDGTPSYINRWSGMTTRPGYNFDVIGTSVSIGNIGRGIYKVRLWEYDSLVPGINSYVEFFYEQDGRNMLDSYFDYYEDRVINNEHHGAGWMYKVTTMGAYRLLEDANGYIKSWDPYDDPNLSSPYHYDSKDFGDPPYEYGLANSTHTTPNPYNQFPLVCISDCSYDFGNGIVTQNQAETGETSSQEGRITLNTIFTKTISTRENYPQYNTPTMDFPLSVESGAMLTIGSGSHHTNSGTVSFNISPFVSNPEFGNILTVESPGSTTPVTTLSLEDQDEGYARNANINIRERCKIIIMNGAKLYTGKYSQVIINSNNVTQNGGTMYWNQGAIVEMKDYSQIIIKNSGKLINEGTSFSNSPGAAIIVENGGEYEISPNVTQTISDGGVLNLNGGKLTIGAGATLIFDGQFANFSVNNNSLVWLGENARIIIRNGAFMSTSGSGNVFSGIGGASWQGIEFDHSRNNNIQNCTFNNARVALKFTFDPSNLWTSSQIAYNNFNVPLISATTTYGIYSEDMNFVGIGCNIFSLASTTSSVGIYMKTTLNGIAEDPDHLYKILIYGNSFNGGNAAMVLLSYAATLKPYIIYGNTFNANTNSIANHGIIGKLITGLIKENTLSSTKTNVDLSLTQSSLNVAHNNLGAISYNIVLNSNSNIKMAPTATNTELILDAGYNDIYSSNSDNIQLGNYQTLLLNNGFNCFSHHGSGMEHLNGGINTTETDYYAYNNYWNPYPPDCNLHNSNNVPMNVHYSQSVACRNLSLSIDQIIDRGNGLIDTVFKAPRPSNVVIIPDEELYNQATAYLNVSDYPSAILNFKSLINGYPESQYLTGALYDMYSTYQGLDTSTNQTLRDNLYSDLKTYLNEKINSNLYSSEFNDLAYNMILMCDANMQNYNDALNGYQFIAMYHSDAITRLMASWDYVELEALFAGMGGSVFEYKNEEEFTLDISQKLQSKISKDSTMKKMKRNYEKEITRINLKTDAEINSSNHIVRDRAIEKKAKDELLIRKSINILMTSKIMTREQRAERQLEDILLISNNGKSDEGENSGNIIPVEYNLSQNYPNPFNPSTTIRYSIPNQSHVVLKIYDLTGREIKTLVNDIKTAGNYSVPFNASGLSSGIYFYKLTAGDFVQTKKMVLIK